MRRVKAFTLVELLVVIGIIAVLISILLPSLSRARQSALALQCMSNLRQLGQFALMYENDYNGAIPGTLAFVPSVLATNAWPTEVWDCKLAPYMGVTLKLESPVEYTYNTPPSRILQCPADIRMGAGYAWSDSARSYTGNATVPVGWGRDQDGVVYDGAAGRAIMKLNMVHDTAETAYLFEYWAIDPSEVWGNVQWNPAYSTTSGWLGANDIPTNATNGFYYHNGKMSVLWCDGHVTQEDPRDAYNLGANGGKTWWSAQ